MFATDRLRPLKRPSWLAAAAVVALSAAGIALAADVSSPEDRVRALLKTRLPKTPVGAIDCGKIAGLCEITAGENLFYVDAGARYLMIGRIYDMQTRQDITAARLLEMNPDMLVGAAARANAAAASGEESAAAPQLAGAPSRLERTQPSAKARKLSLAGLPQDGAIVWGNPAGQTVTVFTDFRCGYCRALTNVLRDMNLRVVERPISVLGSRDVADRVYCARNREAALHAAYAGEPLKAAACDTSGLDANEAFAHRHGINGTPVIVRSDGAMIEGYRPRAFLENWLKEVRS